MVLAGIQQTNASRIISEKYRFNPMVILISFDLQNGIVFVSFEVCVTCAESAG